MRSERLLRIIVRLQSRGRATASDLAAEFEVSVKTIQRDMEALSGAGVPVYATRGVGGGWELLPQYRASLTGLTTGEALAIVVGRQRSVLADLGLEDPGEQAVDKLLGSIPAEARARAEHARQRLLVDPALWNFAGEPEPMLPQLQQATWDDRIVRIRYAARPGWFDVAPLGLVLKSNAWYLVALTNGRPRTYRVSRVHDLAMTGGRFDRPDDFDLAEFWSRSTEEYQDARPSYVARLRVRGGALTRAAWIPVRRRHIGDPDSRGWAIAELEVDAEHTAVDTVRRLGTEVQVLSPASLRVVAVREAKAFVRANTTTRVSR